MAKKTKLKKSNKKKSQNNRSVADNLLLVVLLAVTIGLIFGSREFSLTKNKTNRPILNSATKQVVEKKAAEPTSIKNEALVQNNDSYWKISKRLCGTGKFYLSVKDQNNNKPLHKGDFVSVSCTL